MAAEHVLWAWAAVFFVLMLSIWKKVNFFIAEQVKNGGLNLWRMPIDRVWEFRYSTGI